MIPKPNWDDLCQNCKKFPGPHNVGVKIIINQKKEVVQVFVSELLIFNLAFWGGHTDL